MDDIVAVKAVRIFGAEYRTICVKKGKPIVIAYRDDAETTWTVVDIPFGEDDEVPNNDCFLVTKNRVLFLATAKGYIYRSGDAGRSWQVVDNEIYFDTPYHLATESADRVIFVNKNGIIYSYDDGFTWSCMPQIEWQSASPSPIELSGGQ